MLFIYNTLVKLYVYDSSKRVGSYACELDYSVMLYECDSLKRTAPQELFMCDSPYTLHAESFYNFVVHVCLSHHIQFRLKLKFTTQVSNFLHDFQVNTEYVILKANYCLSAPLSLKVKTSPMPGHKSNAPFGMAIAISTGNFPSDSILKNTSATVKQLEHSFHLTDTKPLFQFSGTCNCGREESSVDVISWLSRGKPCLTESNPDNEVLASAILKCEANTIHCKERRKDG